MKYAILIYEGTGDFATRADPAKGPAFTGAWMAYSNALAQAGVMSGGSALEPPETGTTVRLRDGKRHVQDGPYADTKEQLGGFIIIDVPDLDTALDWASRSPAASYASVEVRPLTPSMRDS